MRIELAKLLLQKPDLILLDEPTNHLDVEAITWLAGHLKKRWPTNSGALMVVTHDRWFLDEICKDLHYDEGQEDLEAEHEAEGQADEPCGDAGDDGCSAHSPHRARSKRELSPQPRHVFFMVLTTPGVTSASPPPHRKTP